MMLWIISLSLLQQETFLQTDLLASASLLFAGEKEFNETASCTKQRKSNKLHMFCSLQTIGLKEIQ